jgi:hypothetical protein
MQLQTKTPHCLENILMFKKRPGRGVSIGQKVWEHEEDKEDTETAGVLTAKTAERTRLMVRAS